MQENPKMGKPDCNPKKELKKGPWTREEDQKLLAYVQQHGHGSWRSLPPKAGLERCGKSCRLRWTNYLRPDIKRGKFSSHEEKTIIRLHALLGNRWSSIAAHLPKRTDNEIKNYWNTRLKKRLTRMGIDPATHRPKNSNPGGSAQSRQAAANVSHMAQWETARLEAEARLASTSRPHRRPTLPPPPAPPRVAALPCLDVLRAWQATAGFSLDSPTSTLNFCSNSGNNVAVPTVINSSTANYDYYGVMNSSVEEKGKMGNWSQVHNNYDDHNNSFAAAATATAEQYDHNNYDVTTTTTGAMGLAAPNQNSELGYNIMTGTSTGDHCVGEFEDIKNYWNDLLNLVSSPMDLHGLLG